MKDFVSTVVGGAIGLVALYVVGRVAFQAGHDIAEAEYRYETAQRKAVVKEQEPETTGEDDAEEELVEVPTPAKKPSKLGMLFSLRKVFGKKGTSVVSELIQNPENHVIEACVKGREIHVNVKPRTA